jgi:hypothetical protein
MDIDLTESEWVNGWIRQGFIKGQLEASRWSLLRVLDTRFLRAVTDEIRRLINNQKDLKLLEAWLDVALRADTFDHFLTALNK